MITGAADGGVARRIRTPRLTLEPIPLAAAAALVDGRPAPGLRAGAGWPHPDTIDALRMDVATADEARTGWFVVLRASGEVVGECGWRGGPDDAGEVEIGYGLAAPYRGLGYGTEAVGALVGWVRRQPDVRRISARVLPGNLASRRLLDRLGFAADGRDGDHLRYVLAPSVTRR